MEPAVNYRLVTTREVVFLENESGAKLCNEHMERAAESSGEDVFLPLTVFDADQAPQQAGTGGNNQNADTVLPQVGSQLQQQFDAQHHMQQWSASTTSSSSVQHQQQEAGDTEESPQSSHDAAEDAENPNADAIHMQPAGANAEQQLRRSTRMTSAPRHLVQHYLGHGLSAVTMLDPTTVKEARNSPDNQSWEMTMIEEMQGLHQNGTWRLEELPRGRQAIKCKWVFRKKVLSDGSLERYKAWLVAKGCSQREGIDYDETFAPVMKFTTFRMLMALAAEKDLELHQVDVKTAFLYGELDEEIYMEQPGVFRENGKEHLVCRLKKALYGLKQAPRCWYEKLEEFLHIIGFHKSDDDPWLFIRGCGDEQVLLVVYIDDEVLAGKSLQLTHQVKADMAKEFEIKDLGEAKYVLGIAINRNRELRMIQPSQTRYLSEILTTFNMQACKGIGTPMNANQKLYKGSRLEEEEEEVEGLPYRRLVGSLMYAMTGTRPDIAYAQGVLAQNMQSPRMSHWQAALRVLRYLQATKDVTI